MWDITIPGGFPERFVFVSLVDAIVGEIYSARDALRHFLSDEIRKKGLEHWTSEIFSPLETAMSDDNWMARIDRLRNNGLHGNYLPENLRINLPAPLGGALTDLRLVGFEKGIVQDTALPDDLRATCDRMRSLIVISEQLVVDSVTEKASRNEDQMVSDGLRMLDSC